ncbi:hypothetical protein AA309_12005 [Microvirga vignae]|uniref:Uncharacterized protein n=1 Tax=Microvirga vignae TaxID=1225564 RepID=A0A0H1RCE0_9HYPH|nr:hypothetical protein [Microvirga vignae]KLK92843.1 hypothetical protein AA309_12005 [Microvirga vignae]
MKPLDPAGQAVAPKPYHPPLLIGGSLITFQHLEPTYLNCFIKNLERTLKIAVKFSNHCFTDHFKTGVHEPSWKVMDGIKERVFCHTRYGLSERLPGMIGALPEAAVWQTTWERNYVYFITLDDGSGHNYPMFFRLKKDKGNGCHLELFVESAYPFAAEETKALIASSSKVKFAILCANVFMGKSVTFKVKR